MLERSNLLLSPGSVPVRHLFPGAGTVEQMRFKVIPSLQCSLSWVPTGSAGAQPLLIVSPARHIKRTLCFPSPTAGQSPHVLGCGNCGGRINEGEYLCEHRGQHPSATRGPLGCVAYFAWNYKLWPGKTAVDQFQSIAFPVFKRGA